ncbi:cullin-associated NEDD8-dissociated protein 1-like [Ornithodoros turicata]|uniref:cullin-associated NEDD8-dissociated protein 1-like n=1 Tax=Ornithodoros turicata TaxID=34597 RepID=UPI003138CB78
MANVSYHIANLLEKMTSSDKDYRFMATNDLMAELQKDSIKLDEDSERKVVKMLLKLLEDKNGEVQNLAVKCLGPLVNKVKEYQVEMIVESLCNNMVSEKEQLRDISSIGLKTVINELPAAAGGGGGLATAVCKKMTGRLSAAVARQEDVSVQLEALDILGDLLARFGALLMPYQLAVQESLLPQLASPRLAVRKRSIAAIGYLVMSCSQGQFNKLMETLLEELAKNSSTSTTRTYIQCIGTISRHAGHRIGEHLEKVMPFMVEYCKVEDDELREYCLQGFESLIRRCPKEISPHVSTIVRICLEYLCYDPNYNYDDEEDENMMDMDRGDTEGESEEEYSDDDDMSWKVRRASAKCLEAVVATRHEMLTEFYRAISPALIARFKEREENVKVDIFHAYMALLRQTRPAVQAGGDAGDIVEGDDSPLALLRSQVGPLVKALHRQLRDKGLRARQGCFALLTELVVVLPGALADHVPMLVPGVQFSLSDKNSSSNMKIDTLAFLNCLLIHHNPAVFHAHIGALIPPIISAVGDSFYKITSEALLVLQQLVKVIRPLDQESSFTFDPYVQDIYHCTLVKLKAADIDQEVKERAITCMGQILCYLGDRLQMELQVCLPIFLDRLRNEITRLTTVKALTKVAGSPLKIDLSPILVDCIPVLASFLRKNQRALKLATLTLMDSLVKNYSTNLSADMISIVMKELPPLISESDLHISQLTLNLLTSISRVRAQSLTLVSSAILPEILVLVRSPLLQGGALNAMLEFFQALVASSLPGLSFKDLLQRLTEPVYQTGSGVAPIHKQAFHSMAKAVAALTTQCPEEAVPVVRQFLQDVQVSSNWSADSVQLFALLAIGEIGRHTDLSGVDDLMRLLLDSFSSQSEEVKTAASFALGSVSVGNLSQYLPFILKEITEQPRRQYLLLHSLKEVISCLSSSPQAVQTLEPFVESIWNLLLQHCECPEEGARNVVAECLGRLALLKPQDLLPRLEAYLNAPSPLARATVVAAAKWTLAEKPRPQVDALLRPQLPRFLGALGDPDLGVRRVALVALNSVAHNKPALVRDLLDSLLPRLYGETRVRNELIREVEMGPFKHTVDDGLDIRKAAFECMYTLLDTCLEQLDIFEFLNHVEDGLKDHYDIKMLTYLMLVRLASLCPSAILQRLERLVEPLKTTCTSKIKANSVKQEFEKQDELKRSAMRAFTALLAIPDADKNPLMNEFLTQIKSTQDLQALYEGIQKDTNNSAVTDSSNVMDIS